MSISKKIEAINNKIVQNKAQYNLVRQTAKIFALSSGNVSKSEFLTGKDVLPEKELLGKAATLKRFEYSPLCKELKSSKFNNLNPQKERTKEKKAAVYNNVSELYNEYLQTYFDECKALSDAQEESSVINMILLI